MKTTPLTLVFLVLAFTMQAHAVEDCETGKVSKKVFLIKTPQHTIIYTPPKLCKPKLIEDFTAVKGFNTQIYTLNWSKQDHDLWHVASYEVRVNGEQDVSSYAASNPLPLPYNLNLPDAGHLASFEVRACSLVDNVQACGDWQSTNSQCATECTDNSLTIPSLSVPAGVNTTGDYTVNWLAANFSNYELQQSTNNGANWVTVYDQDALTKSFINQTNNTNYSYQLRGCNVDTIGKICSNYSVSQAISVQLAIPTLNSLISPNTTGNYTVSWSAVSYDANVVSYQLQESSDSVTWSSISNTHVLSFNLINKPNGVTNYYRVQACRANNNCSNYSAVQSTTILLRPNVPTLTVPGPINTTGNYTVSWTAATYATRYELQERVNNSNWTTVQNDISLSKVFNHTDNDYAYKIRACNLSVCSNYSAIEQITVELPLPAPTIGNLNLIDTDGQYTVSWSSISGVHHYLIEQKIGRGNWISANTGSSTSKFYSHTIDNVNQYRVRACRANNSCGDYSVTKKIILNIPQYTSPTPVAISDIPTVESGSASVGSTNGSIQTDQMGQASYSVPIYTGLGTAGLSPKVSLNYSSGGANGPLGIGWTVSGVTVITRCRETEESRDGATTITPQPITWGTEDKLCLNGERLFEVSGGYWNNASVYRTERDQFARITYYAANYLTVERKDGSIAYYGNTSDSNIKASVASTTPTYAWAINRFQDNMSNYIDYTYNAGVAVGSLEFVLTDIDYTGHLSSPTIAPYNKIHFTYESTRQDKTVAYIAGAQVEMNLRLSQIESKIDNIEVRSYTLNYTTSSTSSRSLMDSIMECRGSTCLPATQFEWSQPSKGFASVTNGGVFPRNIKSSKLGDINGDGRADLVFVDNGDNKFKIAYANASGFGVVTSSNIFAPSGNEIDNKWHLIDYNADGRQDLMRQIGTSWVIHLARAGNSSFDNVAIFTGLSGSTNSDFQIADINGDGLADLLYPIAGLSVRYLERQGSGYGFSSTLSRVDLPNRPEDIPGMPSRPDAIMLGYRYHSGNDINIISTDINGDGVADLILKTDIYIPNPNSPPFPIPDTSENSYQFVSAGNPITPQGGPPGPIVVDSSHWVAFVGKGLNASNELDYSSETYYISPTSLTSSADKRIKFVDINADGLTDILSIGGNNSWQYRLGTGKGFTGNQSMSITTDADHVQLFDYNGDGYTDFLYPDANLIGSLYRAYRWSGNGFVSSGTIPGTGANNVNTNVNFFLDLNGDGRVDHLRIDASGRQKIQIRRDSYVPVDKITSFTNGFGNNTEVYYQPLTFSSVYHQGSGANELNYGNGSPVFDYLSSMYVVRSITTDAPTASSPNNTTSIFYHYQAARVQSGGRGFLGFAKMTTSVPVKATVDTTNYVLETETTYRQDFPYIGLPVSVTVSQTEAPFVPPPNLCDTNPQDCFPAPCFPGEICTDPLRATHSVVMLSQTSNTVDSRATIGSSVFAFIDTTTEQTFDPDTGNLLKTRFQSTAHDNYGNPTNNTIKVYAGASSLLHTTATVNTYINNTSNWKIGLLNTSSVTVSRPSLPSVNTFVDYDYNLTTGLLTQERRMPNDGGDKSLRIRHHYDNFGNETKTISCSSDLSVGACDNTNNMQTADITHPLRVHRYNQLIFDNKGRYVLRVRNSLAQTVSTINQRDIYGNVTRSTDLLGTVITNTYDTLGEKQTSYSSLGTWSYSSKKWCSQISGTSATTCPSNALVRITNKVQGGAMSYSFVDKLGRTISTSEQSFNANNWVINKQDFDQLGRSNKKIGPYFYGASYQPTTHTEYDRYNRVTKVTPPDNTFESVSYNGFTTITTNALFQNKTESKNALGELVEVEDDIGGKLLYTYNVQGLVTEIRRITDGLTEMLIKNTYDKAGRKTKSQDVDTGTTLSYYNAEGEIIRVVDNMGQKVKTYRDVLGRVYLTETFNSFNQKQTSYNYTFNSSNNLLEKETDIMSAEGYQRFYFYDNLKRLQSVSVVINDTEDVCDTSGICNFVSYNYYDQYSRSKIEQDASGKAVENIYTPKGFLQKVRDKNNISKEYYQIDTVDARGNITQDRKSANLFTTYQYDVDRGFMQGITSSAVGTNQNYSYDVLGNLTKRSDGSKTECFAYDDLNRLTATHRSNGASCTSTFGNAENTFMQYDGSGNITQKDGQIYHYNNAQANFIGNSPHQVQSKGSQVFSYDGNGNNISMTSFDSPEFGMNTRSIEYTTFNKIEHVFIGSAGNPLEEAFYKYDTSNNRYARVDINNNTNEKKVTFFIGNTEIEYSNNGQVKHKRQLGNYAIVEEFNGNSTDRYLFTDHLGSVDKITTASGALVQAMSFSAWGERRQPSTWNNSLPTILDQLNDFTNSGYTGHEMVDAFGIINMGGRIYDAALGRMLQADPFVQDPTNTQSFNRYTYVFNNPLSYTDPSGYFSLRSVIGIVVGAVLTFYLGPLGAKIFSTGWAAFIGGFVSGAIITGSLKGAIVGGLTAMATAAVFQGTDNFFTKAPTATPGGAGDAIFKTAFEGANPTVDGFSATNLAITGGTNLASDIGIKITNGIAHLTTIQAAMPVTNSLIPATLGQVITETGRSIVYDQLRRTALAQLDNDANEIRNAFLEGLTSGDTGAGTLNSLVSGWNLVQSARQSVLRDIATKQFLQSTIINTITVVSLATGVGTIVTIARGAAAKGGLSVFSRASEFGIKPYRDLIKLTKGTGLQAHHLIEQRLAQSLGVNAREMLSIALTRAEHQLFTNAWRQLIPYGSVGVSKAAIMNFAQEIYKNHPALLRALGL